MDFVVLWMVAIAVAGSLVSGCPPRFRINRGFDCDVCGLIVKSAAVHGITIGHVNHKTNCELNRRRVAIHSIHGDVDVKAH